MPWFCHTTSKKRSNKTRVGAAGRKSRRKEIERRPTFVVVVKNFTASLRDELSVHRGQVVEAVCTKGSLVYVRDMNSNVGYVPKDHTLDIERIEGTFTNANMVNGENTILSGDNHNITGPAPHPRLIDVSTLQRSGSSVNSVEVHQVSNVAVTEVQDAEEGQATPTSSLSPQVIYEVPRYPDGTAIDTTLTNEDGRKAPALPPRSSCLPSLAEIQADCTYSHDHYRRSVKKCRPGNLSLSSSSSANSCRTNCQCHSVPPRSRYPYGSFPPVSSDTASCKHHTASTHLKHQPYTAGCPPCTPGCSPPAWTPGTTPNGISPCGKKKPIYRAFSANVPGSAHRLGSAGLPASDASAHLTYTPGTSNGSRDLTNQNVNHRLITASSSSSPTSSLPPYGQRARMRAQRSRRYSFDVQVQSTISENISNGAKISHEEDPSKHYSRRRSQPCLVTDRTTPSCLPQQHPSEQPVMRSLSLCGPSCVHAPTGQSSCPCTPLQQKQSRPVSVHRASSYKEAVLSDDVKALDVEVDIQPSEMGGNFNPCHPLESGPSTQRPRSGSSLVDGIQASEDVAEISMCTPDDMSLSDVKKPVGIYRCLRMLKPRFKGAIAVRKNEMVIVLDYGKGDWAWVMTSANIEGLVPKSILVKYHPNGNGIRSGDTNGERSNVTESNSTKWNGTESVLRAVNGNFGINAGTQTEAHHVLYHGSSRSASLSTGYSSSSVPTNESSPLSTSLRAATNERRKQGGNKEAKDGIVLLEAAATAIVEHVKVQEKTRPHTTKEWFNTMDSLDEKERIQPMSPTSLVSRQIDSCSFTQPETAAESSQSSKEETKIDTVTPATTEAAMTTQTTKAATATGGTTMEVVKTATKHQHDRTAGLGSVSFNNKIAASLSAKSGKQRSRQLGLSNVLTVIKNYSPPPTAKNCLTINKGDTLHLQMHMHYPKGWMWVWHTTRRSFGYVPESYIMYAYNTTKILKPRANIQEDDV